MLAPPLEAWTALADLAEDSDSAVIGPRDSRVHEIKTTQFPWNTVVYLCRDFGNGLCAGCSGALVSPTRVLTAAHCLFSLKRMAAPRSIRVCPGRRDRATLPYGFIVAREYYVPKAFRDGPQRLTADWGVIVLPRPFPELRRFLPLRPLDQAGLDRLRAQGLMTVAGYPSDRPLGTMWRHAERLVRADARRLFYTVDTCPGIAAARSWHPLAARQQSSVSIPPAYSMRAVEPSAANGRQCSPRLARSTAVSGSRRQWSRHCAIQQPPDWCACHDCFGCSCRPLRVDLASI